MAASFAFTNKSSPIMSNSIADTDVFVLAAARTPLGGFLGSLSTMTAVQLGAHAVRGTLARTPLRPDEIDEVYFGNVIQAGNGQNPARQVSVAAGLPQSVPATSVNKVCASGLKAVSLAAAAIRCGDAHVIVAGGTESMSNAPHLLPKVRGGIKYGAGEIKDALAVDGLSDAFGGYAMGVAAESTVRDFAMTRDQQDAFACSSYERARTATAAAKFAEILPVEIAGKKGCVTVDKDDEPGNYMPDKMKTLRPAFDPQGSVTAANSSPMSDGAAAVIVVSGLKVRELIRDGRIKTGTTLYKVRACADAEQEPVKFTTTPSVAIPIALKRAGLTIADLDFIELNEAFACVAVANMSLLGVDAARVNVYGGAVALGHPLGCSGARILATLCTVLAQEGGRIGAAAICNGGGGATACIVEKVSVVEDMGGRL
ncbi:Thiolase, N-terminal domain-containing protein [Blastocladiella britannica]|nr:Thiolase, N-terminal domain-containing protein [Blastocladiella britannica]